MPHESAGPPQGRIPEREARMYSHQPAVLPGTQPALRVVPMPADANQHGDIFGGWVMSQVDIAGGVVAAKRARGRVATVAVNSFVFREPVLIGDVVSLYAEIRRVGRTSVTVDVLVYAQRNPSEEVCVKVTEASLTYVAVGPDRRPRELPLD
jgi:acyl-CoA thioesterase YciA